MLSVDISEWAIDDIYSPYPEGSRDKYAVIAPSKGCPPFIIPEHRYLMKFSNRRYPVQFWSEIIAQKVGSYFGVEVPPTFLSIDPKSGEPASLIEWFYGPQLENAVPVRKGGLSLFKSLKDLFVSEEEIPKTHSLYVPGSSYMVRFIPEYDLVKGTQHNLQDVARWIRIIGMLAGTDFWPTWARMLLFDVLIGNTDRHQDNWGVLWRANPDGGAVPRFAPAFDNGTSLGHELMEERLDRYLSHDAVERYVRKGRHHMRFTRTDEKNAGHFDLIRHMIEMRPQLKSVLARTIVRDPKPLFDEIMSLGNVEISVPLSEARLQFICNSISTRLAILRDVIENSNA